jgi:ankyrin repeat protein
MKRSIIAIAALWSALVFVSVTSELAHGGSDDPLSTAPHDCLDEGLPDRALEIMRADKAWLVKKNRHDETPLHIAVRKGYTDVIRWLLENGADPNAVCYNGFTPLHVANDPEIVKLLIDHKAQLNAKDAFARSTLEEVTAGYAHLARIPGSTKERNQQQRIIRMLLAAGAEYDLHPAIYLDDIARVRVLSTNKEQVRDREAMWIAVSHGRTHIVKLLLDRGADPEDADFGGLPLSDFATEYPDILKLLVNAGANPKAILDYHGMGFGPQGSTLLHEAADKGSIESAKLLLSYGLDVNARDKGYGRTPLHVAVVANHTDVAELLLKHGADVNAKDDKGLTPLGLVNLVSVSRDMQNLLRLHGGR